MNWGSLRQRIRWLLVVALAKLLLCLPSQTQAWAALELNEAQRQALEQIAEERSYPVRRHFLRSNERRHDLFFPALARLGGGYLGVGSDQNYTLAAMAQADFIFLVDIDAEVIRWHKIYAALVPISETPTDLLRLLAPRATQAVKQALSQRWPEQAAELFLSYRNFRHLIYRHLRAEQLVEQNGRAVTWMSSPQLYAHIRDLMRTQRVIARIGDLHGERTLLSIGDSARAVGCHLRVIYLSNVEQWFRYSPQFRRNLVKLPHDGRTVVLRTLARGDVPAPPQDRWHFSIQTLDEFIARIDSPFRRLRRVQDLVPDMAQSKRPGIRGLSWLGNLPPPVPRPWRDLPPLRNY